MADATLAPDDFAFIAALVEDRCAVVLEPGKEYLVKSRLSPLMQKYGCDSLAGLAQRLRTNNDAALTRDVVEAMITTETLFFRDGHPFETLRDSVLPRLIDKRRSSRTLNIWCAACSSGQEPYSLAILLREHFPQLSDWSVSIWASDISHQMLERSKSARYSRLEVSRGLPAPLRQKYFREEDREWVLDDSVRRMVSFSQLNIALPWPPAPPWDLILLRNVMIYFQDATKRLILDRIARVLAPDGYLLLGGAETTLNLMAEFERDESLKSGFYRLRPPLPSIASHRPAAS